jgi:exosortase/archaeosortase family protein
VRTDITPPSLREARNFALRGVSWSLGFFGLLRLNWIEAHAVLPFTRVQAGAAAALFGTSALPIDVTLACSGADAIALCAGAVLAYPVGWRMRLAGAGAGAGLIVALNTVRIGTLGRVAASPWWFDALHVYIWPALLTLAIAGYVFAWMRLADRRDVHDTGGVAQERFSFDRLQMTRRFVVLTVAFVLLFTAAAPVYLQSTGLLALAGFIARAAAGVLGAVGVSAYASANVLWTARGSFLVTQECISTPLLPVYLGAVCAASPTWRRLVLGVLAAAPIFIVLGIVRLLVVALPGAVVASPLFLVHAFYQLLLAAVVVCLAAGWRHGSSAGLRHAVAGIVVAVLFVRLLGPFYTRIVTYPIGAPLDDPQEAIAFLPAFQLGLYLALWVAAFAAVGWRRFMAGLAILEVTQMAGLLALQTLGSQSGFTAYVRDIRGWAVAAPLLIVAAVVNVARPSH